MRPGPSLRRQISGLPAVKIYTTVIKALEDQIEKVKQDKAKACAARALDEMEQKTAESAPDKETRQQIKELQESVLSKADLTLSLTKEEYKQKLKKLQKKMELARRTVPQKDPGGARL